MRNSPLLIAMALALACTSAAALSAGTINVIEPTVKEFTLDYGGSFWLENGFGNIEVIGTDEPGLKITAAKVISAADDAALKEAREQTALFIGGDSHVRAIRTIIPVAHSPRWKSYVSYSIRVPRTVHVKIQANSGDVIKVSNVSGNVYVKNVNGTVALQGLSGPTTVESINGNITAEYPERIAANTQLSTVNGQIEVSVLQNANFLWNAETLTGDILSSFPVRGILEGSAYRASVNAPGGPTLTTSSMMGRVFLLRQGSSTRDAVSVTPARARQSEGGLQPARTIQQPFIQGNFAFSTSLGNVDIGEIRGNARIDTGAGEVELGSVLGRCEVTSYGGPLNLGDIAGLLTARTAAGDILVRAARVGGSVWTDGGVVRVLYTGGPTTLHSGGGDIIVRQASGPITADTRSGDITITMDPAIHTQRVEARTVGGNIILRVNPKFGAYVEATVTTSNGMNLIQSDLPGLTIDRRQVGNRTRIRATGRVNGGGERVELNAEDGDIHIVGQSAVPITLMNPADH